MSTSPQSLSGIDRAPGESTVFVALRTRIGHHLECGADEIARRWLEQVRSVALVEIATTTDVEALRAAARAFVLAIAITLRSEGAASEALVGLGLTVGAEAFEHNASLHQTLKAVDLLVAMVLYVAETAVHEAPAADESVSDGIHLCRRTQQAASLLSLAVANGYTQAVGDGMRDQFRLLRHDLRNPLGTIKSVLALMDDQTMPAEARSNPRFRAMAERNARSLEEMIVARLGDAAAVMPALAHQHVSLRTLVCGVRRDLRAEADARNVTVVVGANTPLVHVNAASLELVLLALLEAVLGEAREGDEVSIEFREEHAGRATIVLHCVPSRLLVASPSTCERLRALAHQMGVSLDIDARALLSVAAHPIGVEAGASDLRQTSNELGSADERAYVEPRLL